MPGNQIIPLSGLRGVGLFAANLGRKKGTNGKSEKKIQLKKENQFFYYRIIIHDDRKPSPRNN
jgi:hypothetical protein